MKRATRLKHLADIQVSNVDKKSVEGEVSVRLCNYTDVYYRDRISSDINFMQATAPLAQVEKFRLRRGQTLITKDSEIAEDIGVPAYVDCEADDLVCGYHLAQITPRDRIDPRFLFWFMASAPARQALTLGASGVTRFGLRLDAIQNLSVCLPPLGQQRRIAAFLDDEVGRIDEVVSTKSRIIDLLNERIDSEVMDFVGRSPLAGEPNVQAVPIKHQLLKLQRWATEGEMITAFRDGQVTSRARRGREGFTDSWTDGARVQVVDAGDLVVHGLDGFSGAIGDAEVGGVCSPVNHVCSAPDGDTAFLARMLRLLALSGYLGNFATSTRERAVDFRNWDLFGRIPIPLVPLSEQRRIGEQIRQLRPLTDLVVRSQLLANERRAALITAAVTGEMEVT